jgi:hypothetical protein
MTDNDPNFKGFNTGEIPSWLKKPPKSQRAGWTPPVAQSQSQSQSTTPQYIERPVVHTGAQRSGGSTKATAGILIIATLMSASFWFGFALVLSLLVIPLETQTMSGFTVQTGDVWTFGRTLFCLIVAGILTAVTWFVAMVIAED